MAATQNYQAPQEKALFDKYSKREINNGLQAPWKIKHFQLLVSLAMLIQRWVTNGDQREQRDEWGNQFRELERWLS